MGPTCRAIISLDPASRSFSRWLSQPRLTKAGFREGRVGGMLPPADKKWKSRRPETSYPNFVCLFRLKLKASYRLMRLDFRQLNSRVPSTAVHISLPFLQVFSSPAHQKGQIPRPPKPFGTPLIRPMMFELFNANVYISVNGIAAWLITRKLHHYDCNFKRPESAHTILKIEIKINIDGS